MNYIFIATAIIMTFAATARAEIYECRSREVTVELSLKVDTANKRIERSGIIRGVPYREVHTLGKEGYVAEKNCWEDPIDKAYPPPRHVPGIPRGQQPGCFDIVAKAELADRDLPRFNGGRYYKLEIRKLSGRQRPDPKNSHTSNAYSCTRLY